MLRDHKRAVRRALGNRKTNVREIGNAAPLELAIPARSLRATLDNVARDRSRREVVPIITGPTKLVNQWRERESRICGAARDDNLRSLSQSLNQRRSAEINVRALNR